MNRVRFVPHPEDAPAINLIYNGQFDELTVYIDDEGEVPFITQVNDRLTIEDPYVVLHGEFVRKPE